MRGSAQWAASFGREDKRDAPLDGHPLYEIVQPGTVAVSPQGSRVVVRRVSKEGDVFLDPLSGPPAGGAICWQAESAAEFLTRFRVTGRMRFNGAWKLYQQEMRRRVRAEVELRELRRHLAMLAGKETA